MASTAEHLVARSDPDLLQRLIATAEQAGIPSAQSWCEHNLGQLINADVGAGSTIATVHAYAAAVRQTAVDALPPLPGRDPAAVTDTHLRAAVDALTVPNPT